MKKYVIILSETFPATHDKAGKPTRFKSEFLWGQECSKCPPRRKDRNYEICDNCIMENIPKIHTIRANFPLWDERIKEVQAGRAVLSVRQWTGKPYRSKQIEIAKLSSDDGVGIQELKMIDLFRPATINGSKVELPNLSYNDGLTFNDWYYWFRKYDLSKPMAIIHFTKFRY